MKVVILISAILFAILLIVVDKNRGGEAVDEPQKIESKSSSFSLFSQEDKEKISVISFDIYQLKGKRLNFIKRRSFREGLRNTLNPSGKFKISYNPNIKLIASVKESILKLKKEHLLKRNRDYYQVTKQVKVVVKFALFRNYKKTYYLDEIKYKARIKGGSFIDYEDALYKIDKRLYFIIAQRVANRLLSSYKIILKRVR